MIFRVASLCFSVTKTFGTVLSIACYASAIIWRCKELPTLKIIHSIHHI